MTGQDVTDYLLKGCQCSTCRTRRFMFSTRASSSSSSLKAKRRRVWPVDLIIIGVVSLLVFLVAFAVMAWSAEESEMWKCLTGKECVNKTFYITFPYAIPAGTAIKVQGAFVIDALSRTGSTVWSEEEWKACKSCQKAPIIYIENRAPALKGKP